MALISYTCILYTLSLPLPLPLLPQHMDVEEDSKSLKGQLLTVCPALEKLPSMDDLLGVWAGVRVRMFMHYQLSARAYFTFLKLSGSQAGSSPALDDMNVTASLRLLRLLVKYAVELKSELERGFATTPTKPWKGKPHNRAITCLENVLTLEETLVL